MLLTLTAAAAATGMAYNLLLGYRTDYLGHYLAGFGGTLVLLAAPLLVLRKPLGMSAIVCVVAAVAIGWVTESTVYRIAIFDPVDFCNQSLGAVVAGAGVAGRRGSFVRAVSAAAVGVVCVGLGFVYAFA